MAQSNRHWPSMFKSKPCTTHHHQWQHDINSSLISNSCTKTPYSSVGEERSPEPKPRWNPKPEQIRILEGIFNSGMVNPPRDEIRRIRAQLQEYGQVGDANVFYWFQNRKSRSKHKNRHLHSAKTAPQTQAAPLPPATSAIPASSSSSSEKSSPRPDKGLALGGTKVMEVSNSPTQSVNQTYFASARREFPPETPFLFQVQEVGVAPPLSHSYCFSELSNVVQMPEGGMGHCTGLFQELMNHQEVGKKESEEKMKMPDHQSFANLTSLAAAAAAGASTSITPAVSNSIIHEIQGFASGTIAESGALAPSVAARSTVFINDMAFEVSVGPFSVREAFGDDAVLLHSSGQPVLTNEWGVTIHPLHHGAFYYLMQM